MMMERWRLIAFTFLLPLISSDILYIDTKNNFPIKQHDETENADTAHLPLHSLFAQSDAYKCIVNNLNEEECILKNRPPEQKKIYYGPKFQKIHLALPVRAPQKVGFLESITLNNRQMKITTLSNAPQIFEIQNFLSLNETELIIDLAKGKGMKTVQQKTESNVFLPEKISQHLFDKWDDDFDGHLSITEITKILELNPLLLSEDKTEYIINEAKLDEDENGYISYGELSHGGFQRLVETIKNYEKDRKDRQVGGIEETWVWHDEDELLAYEDLMEDFHERLSKISRLPTELLEQTEPLQVRKYQTLASTHCQQDSTPLSQAKKCCVYGGTNCRMCRYATVLLFLNELQDGGEVVFPLADNQTFSWLHLKDDTIRKCESVPNITSANLVIKPKRGHALMWYNHGVSPYTGWMSEMDPHSLVGIAPIKTGELWTAKLWIDIIGDGVNELRPWRMGTNWLSENNQNKKAIETLRNDYFIENEPYLHKYQLTYNKQQQQQQQQQQKSVENVTQTTNGTSKTEVPETKHMNTTHSKNIVVEESSENILQNNTVESDIDEFSTVEVISPETSAVEQDSEITHNTDDTRNNKEKNDEEYVPLGPPKRPLDPNPMFRGKVIENRLVKASLLLLEELERDELEIIARTLHEKLQLACIPLIVNPLV